MQPVESPARVLMIDDDVDLQSVLGELLESNGFVFASAHSAKEGLAVLDRVHPDVVLLDVVMEDVFAGFRVLAWLRRNPDRELAMRWRQVPVVLMSGVQSAIGMQVLQDAPRALLPIDACLEKPAEPSRVLEAIRTCLARSRSALRSLHEPSLADGA